jgi:RNA polymerase sigma-70 factor (ECF subfamily)
MGLYYALKMPASETQRDSILALVRERILLYAASRVGTDAANDLAQETLMLLDRKYGHVESPDDLVPLAITIMKFKMRELRNRRDFSPPPMIEMPDERPDPEEVARYEELREGILRAVENLGERCQRLFLLKLDGYSFLEIKEKMRADSINTVYTWDFRCRHELRKLMQRKVKRL